MPHTLGTLNWCLILRGKTIPGLIAAMLPLASVASAETCLPAKLTLSNWQEVSSEEAGPTGGSVRCLQSKANSALKLCFTKKFESDECQLTIQFQEKSLGFSTEPGFPVEFEETLAKKNEYKFGCNATTSRIETSISISPLDSVGIYEEMDVPQEQNCKNGFGEFSHLQEAQSYFITNYLVQVGYYRKWENDFELYLDDQTECPANAICPVKPAVP